MLRGTRRLAHWILLAGASFFALILLYALWNHEAYFQGTVRIAAYYLLPFLGMVVLLLATKLGPSRKTNLALLVCTSFLCVYLLELLLAAYPTVSKLAARARADGYDHRSKLEVVRDLRLTGVDAHLLVQPTAVPREYSVSGRHPIEIDGRAVLPLGAIANKTTVGCNETGQYLVYESDEHGFHNPGGLWSRTPVHIAILGDSFALGYCVPSEKNAVALVRRRHPSILNLGMGGNGPLIELATLREFGPELRPRIVFWFYYEGNDLLMDLESEKGHPILLRYLEQPGFRQGLRGMQGQIDMALSGFVSDQIDTTNVPVAAIVDRIQLTQLRSHLGLALGRSFADLGLFEAILARAKESVQAWGGQLYVVYLPAKSRFESSWFKREDFRRQEVVAILEKLGLPWIDVRARFADAADPVRRFYTRGSIHFNEAGYEEVADAMLDVLEQ